MTGIGPTGGEDLSVEIRSLAGPPETLKLDEKTGRYKATWTVEKGARTYEVTVLLSQAKLKGLGVEDDKIQGQADRISRKIASLIKPKITELSGQIIRASVTKFEEKNYNFSISSPDPSLAEKIKEIFRDSFSVSFIDVADKNYIINTLKSLQSEKKGAAIDLSQVRLPQSLKLDEVKFGKVEMDGTTPVPTATQLKEATRLVNDFYGDELVEAATDKEIEPSKNREVQKIYAYLILRVLAGPGKELPYPPIRPLTPQGRAAFCERIHDLVQDEKGTPFTDQETKAVEAAADELTRLIAEKRFEGFKDKLKELITTPGLKVEINELLNKEIGPLYQERVFFFRCKELENIPLFKSPASFPDALTMQFATFFPVFFKDEVEILLASEEKGGKKIPTGERDAIQNASNNLIALIQKKDFDKFKIKLKSHLSDQFHSQVDAITNEQLATLYKKILDEGKRNTPFEGSKDLDRQGPYVKRIGNKKTDNSELYQKIIESTLSEIKKGNIDDQLNKWNRWADSIGLQTPFDREQFLKCLKRDKTTIKKHANTLYNLSNVPDGPNKEKIEQLLCFQLLAFISFYNQTSKALATIFLFRLSEGIALPLLSSPPGEPPPAWNMTGNLQSLQMTQEWQNTLPEGNHFFMLDETVDFPSITPLSKELPSATGSLTLAPAALEHLDTIIAHCQTLSAAS